ncbi:hypothetical protein ARMSODRAFT_990361 [Armillaria solidipes]|uniref:Aspartic peptidase DDI1-type domain-containing protein n=1 Tax=Armillaria solidipes TaxID=1076256 RepID=A0A2H3B1U1_9AGAR|nr:hypothetical protein ARMSODRAFT_990361 [Armillaria solidipes]
MNGNLRWEERNGYTHVMSIAGVQIEPKTYPAIQRHASVVKDIGRVVPRPLVIVVDINGKPCRALVDTGSLGDFMSTQLADQLKVFKTYLPTPIPLHLAVQFKYQSIKTEHYFDIANLSSYDLVLGTPWLYQHNVRVCFNPSSIEIGSDTALPMIRSQAMMVSEDALEQVRTELQEYVAPICKTAAETPLPPLRAINHTIPLIDEHKVYPWRPSRCPEAFRSQWDQKRRDYLSSGRWKLTTSGNSVPMLLIPKVGKQKHLLRTMPTSKSELFPSTLTELRLQLLMETWLVLFSNRVTVMHLQRTRH